MMSKDWYPPFSLWRIPFLFYRQMHSPIITQPRTSYIIKQSRDIRNCVYETAQTSVLSC